MNEQTKAEKEIHWLDQWVMDLFGITHDQLGTATAWFLIILLVILVYFAFIHQEKDNNWPGWWM